MRRDTWPPEALQPVLRVHGVDKAFTLHLRGGLRLPVLHGVGLEVHAGECVALVGRSGSGKSTLMKCLHGSYGVDAGEVYLRGSDGLVDLARAEAQQVLALRRRDIAYVSQFLRAPPRVPAIDVVAERVLQSEATARFDDALGADDARMDDDARVEAARARVGALLERLNLPRSLWSLPPATFSGGEQQRINIARGLVVPARLLLLDEPTASLDAANRQVVVQLIGAAKAAGTAVVGIFHDEEVRAALATRCVELQPASNIQ